MALLTWATHHRSVIPSHPELVSGLFRDILELLLLIGVILKQVQDDVPIIVSDDLE